MTQKQRLYFYFPAWNRAARAQQWRTEKGRLIGTRQDPWGAEEVNGLYQAVWGFARRIATRAGRAPLPDDFRHAVHVMALTQDKSSTDLTSKELDRVVAAFRLLADPDDFDAMMIWLHPENGVRDRQIWFIENRVVERYARKVCQSKFGTGDWHSLTNENVRDLVMTLKNRPSGLKPSHPSKPEPAPMEDQPQHPINLAKERELREEREAAELAETQPF